MTSAYRSVFNLSAHQRPTVGDQKMSYTGVDHMGWLVCDGRALSTETYALLFGVIGYTFGGSGNTFNLPDFRGCVPGMAGQPQFSNSANPATYTIGQRTGEQIHVLTISEMPAHKHGSVDVTGNTNGDGVTSNNGLHNHTGTTDPAGYAASNTSVQEPVSGTNVADDTGSHTHTFTTTSNGLHNHVIGSTGGSQAHNNMQPTLFAGNMFIYSGKVIQQYFPYTWVGATPAYSSGTAGTPGSVLIF